MHAAWKDAGGHALTLSLLGRFIADAYEDRDIRHYREVKFEAADQEHQGRSAFKVMIAYERWLQSGGPERQRELAVLRLTGLFDRPMAKSCLQALRAEPSIPGLTDALVKLTPQQWNIAVKRLSEVELLSVSPDAIDAHPLIREYFAAQLKRDQPEAFRAAHSRLFDYLCENTPHRPDGMDGLAPLYEAVTHGCLAGRHQEACDKVYIDRILRGTGSDGFYSWKKLGAIGADLAAVAAFFDEPWSQVSPNLTEADQAWLLNEAAFRLRALGRLTEALQPMRAGLEMAVQQKDWKNAAIGASNLSELEVTLGRLAGRRDRRPPVDHPRRPERRCVPANEQSHHGGGCVAPVRPAGRSRHPLRRGRTDAAGKAAAVRPALFAARLPVLRLAAGPRRTRRVADVAHVARCVTARECTLMTRIAMPRPCAEVERRATTTLKWAIDTEVIRSSPSPSIT